MKFIFMGTPQFAVQSLKRLVQSSHELLAVVTVPDKPAGRGRKIRFSPVKDCALDYGVPILQPQKLNDTNFVRQLRSCKADVFIVVAFRILPEEVFTIPPKGTVNLHSSLLPQYRGAAPINWVIINGETETGVSTIFIQKEVDAGDVILQEKIPVGNDVTAGELHDRLAALGAEVLVKTIDLIETGTCKTVLQKGDVTAAPKITRELCEIDWAKPAADIRNLIRGLNPVPGAFSFLNGKIVKFFQSKPGDLVQSAVPGEIIKADAKSGHLVVATGHGNLQIEQLQPEGKRKMTAKEFLLGNQITTGDLFGK